MLVASLVAVFVWGELVEALPHKLTCGWNIKEKATCSVAQGLES